MTDSKRERIEQLFDRLVELSADEQATFLEEHCDDVEVRNEVRALLEYDRREGGGLTEQHDSSEPVATIDAPSDFDDDLVGNQIGPYKLRERIGEGGMGAVYVADQKEPVRRRVALKIIKPGMDSRQVIARFEAERQALALMDHPNIARVLDAGTTNYGRPYFVMELVNGVPITEYCDQKRLSPRQRLQLFLPVCQAVQHAHQKGIIHRDLKPSNILVALYDGDPVPKVIDFGIAKATNQSLSQQTIYTHFGQIIGTLEYMSPEQAERNQLDIDTRSDIYSLGVVLYELLTGATPFDRKRLESAALEEVLRIIREEDPLKPSTKLSSSDALPSVSACRNVEPAKLSAMVRGELDWIVMKALDKDRGRRYETASSFAADIQNHLENEPVAACPPTLRYRIGKFVRKHRVAIAAISLFFALLLGGVVATSWQAIRARRAEAHAVQKQNEARHARQAAEHALENEKAALKKQVNLRAEADRQKAFAHQQLDRAEWLLYANRIRLAQSEWNHGEPAIARAALDSCWLSFRGWEHDYLHTEITRNQRTFRGHANAIDDVAFSPDGKLIVSGSRDNTVKLWDVETGEIIDTLQGHEDAVTSVCFSPDGSHVASAGADGTVRLWDVKSDRPTFLPKVAMAVTSKILVGRSWRLVRTLRHARAVSACFSPDGSHIATASKDKTVRLWNTNTGRQMLTLLADDRVSCVAFSPDGTRLAGGITNYQGSKGEVWIWNIESRENTHILRGHNEAVRSVAFSPDGARIVSGSCLNDYGWTGDMRLWNAETGAPLRTLSVNTSGVFQVSFSRAGNRIVSANGDGSIRIWDVDTGRELQALKGHLRMASAARFSPDGQQIVSGSWDNTIKVWNVEAYALRGHHDSVRAIECSRDGRWFVSGGDDNTVRIWAASTGRQHRVLIGHTQNVLDVDLSSDGRTIVSTGLDGSVRIWDRTSGLQRRVLRGHRGLVTGVALTPDGRRIVSSGADGTVRVWDVTSGQSVHIMSGHDDVVTEVAVSPTKNRIASVSIDKSVIVWNAQSGMELRQLFGHEDEVTCVSFSPNGEQLATGGGDKTVRIWDVEGGELRHTLRGHAYAVSAVRFSPDGRRVVSGSYDNKGNPGELIIWDVTSGQELLSLNSDGLCLSFSPDGKRILSGGIDGTIRVWDASNRQYSHVLDGQSGGIRTVRYSPDGKRIASAGLDDKIRIWDAKSGAEQRLLSGHSPVVLSLDFSPDGERIVSSGGDAMIRVWDVATGTERVSIPSRSGNVLDVTFSPNGVRIVGCDSDDIKIWDAETGDELMTLTGHLGSVAAVGFSPDGEQIISAGTDKLIRLWNADSGQQTMALAGHNEAVRSIGFSLDSTHIVSGSSDDTVRLWDANTGEEKMTLTGHDGPVRSVDFDASGKRVVSASSDKTIKVWNVSTGEEVWSFDAHTDVVRDVQFSPDGKSLVSGSDDGSVRIWALPDGREPSNYDQALSAEREAATQQREPETTPRLDMPTGPMIFWTDRQIHGICRVNLDGTNAQAIVWNLGEPRDLMLHDGTDLYFCDYELDRICKTDLSGAATQIVFSGTPGVRGIAVDDRSSKIYWTDRDLKKVFRANLDGTDIEEVMSERLEYPYKVQIDPIADKLFVEDHVAGGIFRANLDGSEPEKFVEFSSSSLSNGGLVVDAEGRALFYKDSNGRKIMRIGLNIDDDKPELVIRTRNDVLGLTIDKKNKKLYWADTAIRRCDFDGSQMETVVESTLGAVKSIVVYHPPSPMSDGDLPPGH